jgi:beta-lactamase class A
MISRRRFVVGAGAGTTVAGFGMLGGGRDRAAAASLAEKLDIPTIEAASGGRLGVAFLDTTTGARAGHRADERFPLCSTFKVLAAAAVLARVDAGQERLDRRIRFAASDLVVNSPATKERAGTQEGMSLDELCAAAMTMSDNTAGNLLLAALGGPEALTAYIRSLGDATTRLDRIEPELNEARPGDPRDTTTPAAMAANLRTLLLGNVLAAPSRERLTAWLVGNKTGDARLRAGLPKGWRVGDKTGSGGHGSSNDVAVIWPDGRAPVIVASYLTETTGTDDQRNAAHAAVGRAVAAAISG